ncbi:hypothetical protein G3I28_08375, partial [Streptomyces sp. SID10116]|nr:hypothetical protein [Streptomyces sp. SID10116]
MDGSGSDTDVRMPPDAPGASADDLPGVDVMGGPTNADGVAGHHAPKLERGPLIDAVRTGIPTPSGAGPPPGAQLLARAGLWAASGAPRTRTVREVREERFRDRPGAFRRCQVRGARDLHQR